MQRGRNGISVFAVLFPAIVCLGFVEFLRQPNTSAVESDRETKQLRVAETGLEKLGYHLEADPLWAVKNLEGFSVDPITLEYVSTAPGSPRLHVRYSSGGSPFIFANREDPLERWDSITLASVVLVAGRERRAVARYRMEVRDTLANAIVCTAGEAAFANSGRLRVFGGIHAGQEVRVSDDDHPLDTRSAKLYFDSFSGSISTGFAGAMKGCAPSARLFDIDRFEAVARAGAGQIFEDLASFARACNDANASRRSLEGVIVVHVGSNRTGDHPSIVARQPKAGEHQIADGIHIRGTLLFRFRGGKPHTNRLSIDTPLNVNAADLSHWQSEDESTYPTGYPPTFADSLKAPWSRSITPRFESFTPQDGLPALMVDAGSLSIRGATNVCGTIYVSSHLHLANASGRTLFFHGSMLARDGVTVENARSGLLAIRFDPGSLAKLQTRNNAGKGLTRTGFAVLR